MGNYDTSYLAGDLFVCASLIEYMVASGALDQIEEFSIKEVNRFNADSEVELSPLILTRELPLQDSTNRKTGRLYQRYPSVAASPYIDGFGDEPGFDGITLESLLVENPEESYILNVSGNSMIDCGIYDGSWLIVQRYHKHHLELKGGEIVIASFRNFSSSAMVKIYHRDEENRVFLISANREEPCRYPSTVITEADDLLLHGVVKKVIHEPTRMSLSQRDQYLSGF